MQSKREEIREELVRIKNNVGEHLLGDITFPQKLKEKNPAILLVHGFGVERTEEGWFTEFAHRLSSAGYLVFKFDFSGCGDSQGDYGETTLTKLKNDLKAMLDFVREHPQTDKNKIGILAQSFGTAVTVALKPAVETIVLMGSAAHPYEVMKDIFEEGFNPNGISSLKRSDGSVTKLKAQFWQDLKNYDLVKNMEEIIYPILFIHGEEDDKVPISEMRAYFQAKEGAKETNIQKGADHGLIPKRDEVYPLVKDWFNKHLKR